MNAGIATGRVPFRIRVLFGSGSIAEGTKNTAFNVFLLYYYNNVLGLSGTLSGAAILLALCVDAITDPLVGSISDNFRSRWGRRHPFMYAAAVPMAVCFYLLFNPPAGMADMELFAWLTVFAVGVRVSMTFYAIPSASMIPELTTHYDERTTLVSFRFFFGWTGGLAISLLGYQYFFAPSAAFEDGLQNAAAYGAFAVFCSFLIALAILACAAGTHELIPRLRQPPDGARFSLRGFVSEMRNALSNRSYVMLLIGSLFSSIAGGFGDVVGLYMNNYFWGFTTDQMSLLLAPLAVGMIVAVIFTRSLAELSDKRKTALRLASFGIFFGPLPVFLRLLGWMPQNGDPLLLYLLMGHGFVIVACVVGIFILISSMIADVVDENELATGKRQEGIFVSAIAFTSKATSGIGSFVAGVALDLIEFPRQVAAGTIIPPEKIFMLGLAVGPGLFVLYVFTLIFLSGYKISRERHAEILAALAARRPPESDPVGAG